MRFTRAVKEQTSKSLREGGYKYLGQCYKFTPWVALDRIWDTGSWERVIHLAHRKEIQDGKTYPLTFYPIVNALLACLMGIPVETHLGLQDILAAQVEHGNG